VAFKSLAEARDAFKEIGSDMQMDKRLYAVVAVGVLFSGAAHAIDCQTLPVTLQFKCGQTNMTAEKDRKSREVACFQLKMNLDRAKLTGTGPPSFEGDPAMVESKLKRCTQEFPDFNNWSVEAVPARRVGPQ
jgi:hypothetical protein